MKTSTQRGSIDSLNSSELSGLREIQRRKVNEIKEVHQRESDNLQALDELIISVREKENIK